MFKGPSGCVLRRYDRLGASCRDYYFLAENCTTVLGALVAIVAFLAKNGATCRGGRPLWRRRAPRCVDDKMALDADEQHRKDGMSSFPFSRLRHVTSRSRSLVELCQD